jgi:hypothetical protein
MKAESQSCSYFSLSSTLNGVLFESQRQAEAYRTFGPRSRHRSSKPNLQASGGKARGSTPPRASKIMWISETKIEVQRRVPNVAV